MQNQSDLTKRLLIRTFRDYAAQQVDEIFDQIIEGITANLQKYADAIQAETPRFWPWLVERSKVSAFLRPQIDEVCFKVFDREPDGVHQLVALMDLYLADHPQLAELYDLAISKTFEGVSDADLERIIEETAP